MVRYAVSYGFKQKFPFSAQEAYEWSVDFRPDDIGRMGNEGRRKIERIDDNTLILEDVIISGGKSVTKTRLVKLYPQLLMWTNTRISEAGKHSQFIYRIVPEGKHRSRLEFTGAQVEESEKKPTKARLQAICDENARHDAGIWVLLAKEMKKDLGAG